MACGTDGDLEHLRSAFVVEGVEASPHMASIARTKLGVDVPVHEGDMRDYDLGRRIDAVTCLFSRSATCARPRR